VNPPDVLARYDAQVRRAAAADPPARIDQDAYVVRHLDDTGGWEGVVWSGLDAVTADAEIARQVKFFSRRGGEFEWKHYGHDRPADLPARLTAAGFIAGEPEALMVAATDALALDGAVPAGLTVVEAGDAEAVDLVLGVHDEVFGTDHRWLRAELLNQLAAASETGVAVLAMAGERAVSSARVNFHSGTDFASLWGGGTLPAWRGRGIYQALVAYRARLAAERGFGYLQVDALPPSRPILERLGFTALTMTTPYLWLPSVSRSAETSPFAS